MKSRECTRCHAAITNRWGFGLKTLPIGFLPITEEVRWAAQPVDEVKRTPTFGEAIRA